MKMTTRLLMTLMVACISQSLAAFPLDPVRIYVPGRAPSSDKVDITASIYQGGTYTEDGSGKLLYRERQTVQPDGDGDFAYWLGDGSVLYGKLQGPEFGLDKTLYLDVQVLSRQPATPQKAYRVKLSSIDNAYVASQRRRQVGESEHLRGKFFRSYAPAFRRVVPDMVRTGVATLFPDGRIQTETGAFLRTDGTQTSGVQELFDYCESHNVDGYIVGGAIPKQQQIRYLIWEPLQLPARQGFRLDTGSITMEFMPEVGSQPGLTINSCMMCDIRIRGLLHYRGEGYALAVHASDRLPLDKFVGETIVDSAFYISSIACRGARGAVVLDGEVNYCTFTFNEVNHGDYGIHVTSTAQLSNNRFTCKHVHGQEETSVLVETGSSNVWEINTNCDGKDPRGIVTSGQNDVWFANVISRSKKSLTLGKTARGNQFHTGLLSNGFENHAQNPINRIYPATTVPAEMLKTGYAVDTPEVGTSGIPIVNRNPYPVVVWIKHPGSVTQWGVTDTYGVREMVDAPLLAGQSIYLAPAESITLHYAKSPPTWKWRAIP